MNRILDRIKSEPVLTHAFFVSALGVAVAFGLDFTGEQLASLNTLVLAGLSFLVRGQVTPLSNLPKAAG